MARSARECRGSAVRILPRRRRGSAPPPSALHVHRAALGERAVGGKHDREVAPARGARVGGGASEKTRRGSPPHQRRLWTWWMPASMRTPPPDAPTSSRHPP